MRPKAEPVWWLRRGSGEPTATYLARVLEALGEPDLAVKARAFHYDDYLRPAEIDDGLNIHALIRDLQVAANGSVAVKRRRVAAVIAAAKEGEFDGTTAESEAWERSPEGQAALAELLRGI